MNLSEYKLITALTKEVGEPNIAIMIAEDALDLGKRIFNIKKNIDECQKKIEKINSDINDMTEEEAIRYLNYRCDNCDTFHEWEDEIDESAMEEAKRMAKYKIRMCEHDMFHFMEDYELIMGKSYNIDYIIDKLVNNAINESIKTLQIYHYNKLKEMFNSNEEQDKSLIVKTLKNLLNECENAKTKFKKFEIVTCMMCVISNSPIFLSKHERFKDTVLAKLNELSSQINDIRIDKTEYYNYIEKIRTY
jgi:hypothetical protein